MKLTYISNELFSNIKRLQNVKDAERKCVTYITLSILLYNKF